MANMCIHLDSDTNLVILLHITLLANRRTTDGSVAIINKDIKTYNIQNR